MADDPRLLSDAEIAEMRDADESEYTRSLLNVRRLHTRTSLNLRRLLDHIAALTEERKADARAFITGLEENAQLMLRIDRLSADLAAAAHERDRVTKVLRERIEVDAMLRRDFPIAHDLPTADDTGGA